MDYYTTLGINKQASSDDIKRAYRKLASQHHPDKGGDTAKFQKIQQAYDVLSDDIKRNQYDKANDPLSRLESFFAQFQQNPVQRQKIYTVNYTVSLEQIAMASNESVAIQTPDGTKLIHIKVPKGLENGHTYRYDNALSDGLLNITFNVLKHDRFERMGLDLYTSEKIEVFDLILGTSIEVKTIYDKTLEVEIPPMTKIGAKFKLAGQGLHTDDKKGDHYILLHPVLPEKISSRLISEISKEKVYNLYKREKND